MPSTRLPSRRCPVVLVAKHVLCRCAAETVAKGAPRLVRVRNGSFVRVGVMSTSGLNVGGNSGIEISSEQKSVRSATHMNAGASPNRD